MAVPSAEEPASMAVRTVVPKGCVAPAGHRSDVPVGRIAPRKMRHVMRTATLLWTSPVYEPEVRDTLPVHVIALAEGEEAVESVSLEWSRNDRLACDGVVISDARVLAPGQPSFLSSRHGHWPARRSSALRRTSRTITLRP